MASYVFNPPLAPLNPPYLPSTPPGDVMLWRHFRPRMVGVNVYLLNNGTYVQTTATPTLITPVGSYTNTTHVTSLVLTMTNLAGHMSRGPQPPWTPTTALKSSNVPYPWNPTNPNAPYVHIQNFTGSTTTVTLTPRIEVPYWGGHTNVVTATAAAKLIAAGYGTCIREETAA